MFKYYLFGKNVLSDIELDCGVIKEFDRPDVWIKEGFDEALHNELRKNVSDKMPALRAIEEDNATVFFEHAGSFRVTKDTITYRMVDDEDSDKSYAEQVLLCMCFPLLLTFNNVVKMHGSAVFVKDKLVLVSGLSGSGKSTLAAEIISHYGKYMSDDIVPVRIEGDSVIASTSFFCRKLCPDAASEFGYSKENALVISDPEGVKYGVQNKDEYVSEDTKLSAMIIIHPEDDCQVAIERQLGAKALVNISQNLFRVEDYVASGNKNAIMPVLLKMASLLPVYIIKRPNGKMTVQEQIKVLEQELEMES